MSEPDLWDAHEESERLVRYFEEVEDRLSAQSDAPVHLVETQSARLVSIAISSFLAAERERARAWMHSEPSEVAREFAALARAFVRDKHLDVDELAAQLKADASWLGRLVALVDD